MTGRILGAACALAIGFAVPGHAVAQARLTPEIPKPVEIGEAWHSDVTVVAIAPDGTWGVATEPSSSRAIANAIGDCRTRYQRAIGCGHRITSIRAGWSLAIRCGDNTIVVAARSLREAEQHAADRELELRQAYAPDMPPCVRVVSVDPSGAVVAPDVTELLRAVMARSSGVASR
jgi:hypothetical protein